MKKVLMMMAALPGVLPADGVHHSHNGRSVIVKFDEPVVPLSVVQNGYNSNATKQDKGLNLFDITGDAQFTPTARWVDQDRLEISYCKGFNGSTVYRLAFRPGADKYLSGKPMQQSSFEFSYKGKSATSTAVESGLPRAAVCVYVDSPFTRAQLDFSPQSAVSYVFREVVNKKLPQHNTNRYGRTVKGVPSQAELRHLDPAYGFRALFDDNDAKSKDVAALSLTTPIPGHVLVMPETELGGGEWELQMDPDIGSDLTERYYNVTKPQAPTLAANCELQVPDYDPATSNCTKPAAMELQLHIGTPVLKTELVNLYRSISLKVGDTAAVSSEDGRSKTITLPDGKTLIFTLNEQANDEPVCTIGHGKDTPRYSYTPPVTEELRLSITGTAQLPQVVNVTLPAGTRAMLGAESKEEVTCRLTLTPAVPALECSSMDDPQLVPAGQPRKLRLFGTNLSSLHVSAARLTPEQYLEYINLLSRENFGQVEELAARQYDLALARTRHKISEKMASKDEISRLQRQIRRLWSEVPDVAALRRRMPDVTFSSEQQLPTTAVGPGGLQSNEAVLDFDALMGGRAQPGYYVVAVRNQPTEDVANQLRTAGADPALYTSEQWFAVLITDLNLITGTDAIAVTRLSDGTPVQQGQLLESGREPISIQHAVALVPPAKNPRGQRPNSTRRLVLQSGDDYCPIRWSDYRTSLSTDSRLEIVRDRGTYRPGEVVHLRGVLRRVSPQGVADLPGDTRRISITVRRPNGQVLQQKNIAVNPYGAFDYELTLPEGDEDITGTYRILAESGDYRAYAYIPCQVFRRDSFTVKSELTMPPVCPREYSVKVTATDLNGTPLSGARVKLTTTLHINALRDESKGDDIDISFGPEEEVRELTLGADGTATLTGKLPELPAEATGSNLHISGEVTNDRQEVMQLPSIHRYMYPADFTATLLDGEKLILHAVEPNGKTGNVLARDQKVHLHLRGRLPRVKTLPNGVSIHSETPLTLWEGDITVPANSTLGVDTGLSEHWQRFINSLTKDPAHAHQPMQVELTATDAAGHKLVQNFSNYSPTRSFIHPGLHGSAGQCRVQHENGTLKVTAEVERAGQMVAVLRSVLGTRALPVQHMKEGTNEFTLPLQDGECGQLSLCFMQPVKEIVYNELQTMTTGVQVPRKAAELKVELDLPQQNVRPGERITLRGKVLGPDGKPAAAQVTLFAVDEGMLSIDNHRVPNLLTAFTQVWVDSFSPRVNRYTLKPQPAAMSLLRGVWGGEKIGKDGSITLPVAQYTSRRYSRKRALGYVANNAAADADMIVMEESCAAAPAAPIAMKAAGARKEANLAMESAEPMALDGAELGDGLGMGHPAVPTAGATQPAPRLRTNFVPVAVWAPALMTDDNGCFTTEVTLPDTLTTYKVYALALGADGKCFGNGESSFTANQPVMLTAGTPYFMSLGDALRLPLTITNATDSEDTWSVTLDGAATQKVTLQPKSTTTLYFDYKATAEGERKLHWQATAAAGGDAVEGTFNVRFPAPLLKEAHHLVLTPQLGMQKVAALLAPELAGSTRGEVEVQLSANPLLHLYGCMELVHGNTYPCSHYNATAMLTWMLYDRLAPFSPLMAETPAAKARNYVTRGIAELLKCQLPDGGVSYWLGARESSPWASAYVGLVLTLAQQQGFDVPADKMTALQNYLREQLKLSRQPKPRVSFSPFDLYAIGRTIGDRPTATEALATALGREEKGSEQAAIFGPAFAHCWWRSGYAVASLRFLAEMDKDKTDLHGDFLRWMRAVGHDYRHATTWDGGWMLIALHEYLRHTPAADSTATLTLQDGQQLTLGQGMTTLRPAATGTLGELPTTLTATDGTIYLTVNAKALPERTEYPGITEKGLQITRIYEKKGADGVWRKAHDFNVGDVVRVTLTCAKGDRELNYFVLEDYLPACMEAINPAIPSQAAGLEWRPWSHWFDHREFLAHRVRGFCTRWGGRDLLNMCYYARVKRAGTATAPPAQAQLLYEPQTYGLSENVIITSN